MVNIDVPAGVGAPPLNTQLLVIFKPLVIVAIQWRIPLN